MHKLILKTLAFVALCSPVAAGDVLFWLDNFSVTSAPGIPLTGSGFGVFSGNFSNVNYVGGTNPGTLSGSFNITIGWSDVDPIGSPGIPWSVDPTIDALVFDTAPGDILLAGAPSYTLTSIPPGWELCAVKTLICLDLGEDLQKEMVDTLDAGNEIYYRAYTEKGGEVPEFIKVDYDRSGRVVLQEGIRSTDGLEFYSLDRSGEIGSPTKMGSGLQFDTGIKLGGCLCAIPEPSGAFCLLTSGLLFLVRRRRHLAIA